MVVSLILYSGDVPKNSLGDFSAKLSLAFSLMIHPSGRPAVPFVATADATPLPFQKQSEYVFPALSFSSNEIMNAALSPFLSIASCLYFALPV
ncbi:MAG: hypothetical protein BWY89_01186 [Bacteroidetes bacterium ADurb.BinA012]|nr:MAG: hypothetical protein BWY89_01186 [Bacteroidetes bacterium ADurb.BinA012]